MYPGRHDLHLTDPTTSEKYPGAHAWQERGSPLWEKYPALHGMHSVPIIMFPGPHKVQPYEKFVKHL
jgi:hypothetical protein